MYEPARTNGAGVISIVSGGWRSDWNMLRQFVQVADGTFRLMTDAEILQQGGILPSHSYRRLLDKGFTVSLAKTGVARLSLTIANTSRQEPSRDTAETS